MSTTTVAYPIVGAVRGTEKILGENLSWKAMNDQQKVFLVKHFAKCKNEVLTLKEIETIASWEAGEINQFLKKKGFSITLDPFQEGEFGVASVLDLLVQWVEEGKKVPIVHDGEQFPGVRLKTGVEYLMSRRHTEAIAQVKTKSDDVVYMTMLDKAPQGFELVDLANHLTKSVRQGMAGYKALQFPMVDLNQKVDIDWLKGMTTTAKGRPWKISQAKQQTKLRMNEKGARAQSAVAVGVFATSVRPPAPELVINRPFLVWFTRPGLAQPLFVGHITPEDWKAPKDLETP